MITIVGGNMRCGSSLVMRMLGAAGVPLFYTQPDSFEHDGFLTRRNDIEWVRGAEGRAIKWLDPIIQGGPPKGLEYRTISLTRDAVQQHRSQVHFLSMLGYDFKESKASRRNLEMDNRRLKGFWKHYGPVLSVTFEALCAYPLSVANSIAAFCGGLDAQAMADQVIPRSPDCTESPWEVEIIPSADLWRGTVASTP